MFISKETKREVWKFSVDIFRCFFSSTKNLFMSHANQGDKLTLI